MTADKGSLVVVLKFAFVMFTLLTPYLTGNNIEALMSDSINKDYSDKWHGTKWNGFKALAILYFTLGMFSWLTPPIMAAIGPKVALGLGGLGCSLSLVTFLFPFKYGLNAASIVIGCSSAVIFTGQGAYLAAISNSETATRNTGIVFTIGQLAPILGNSIATLAFSGKDNIPKSTRTLLYSILIGVGCAGAIIAFVLLKTFKTKAETPSPIEALKNSFKVLATKRMALLSTVCFYSGLGASFMGNLYGTTVGYTKSFGVNRKQYAGTSGIFIGLGEFSAGCLLILTRNHKKPENLLILAYLCALLTFGCTYLNLPDAASHVDTADPAIIHSSVPLAFLCAFLLGLVDGCFTTQISQTIVRHYPEDSAGPFSIYFSISAMSMALMNLFSSNFGLHFHCIFLSIAVTIGTTAFFASGRVKDSRGLHEETQPTGKNDKTRPIEANNHAMEPIEDEIVPTVLDLPSVAYTDLSMEDSVA